VGVKVTPDLRGCPPVSFGRKIYVCAILKDSKANCIPLESLINEDFEKNKNCQLFLIPQKKIAKNDRQNDHASFN